MNAGTIPAPSTNAQCSGYWGGSDCNICTVSKPGVSCNDDGTLLGCDGLSGTAFNIKYLNPCGVCNGPALCTSCLGYANDTTKLDSCGVCGGDGTCEEVTISALPIIFTWGILPDGSDDLDINFGTFETQMEIFKFCANLVMTRRFRDVRCLFSNFANAVNATTGRWFPFGPDLYNAYFLQYAKDNNRLDEVGFWNPAGGPLRFVTVKAYLPSITSDSTLGELGDAMNYVNSFVQRMNRLGMNRFMMTTPIQGILDAQSHMVRTVLRSLGVGIAICCFFLINLSRSVRLTVMGVVCVCGNLLMVLAFFNLMGWSLRTTEMLAAGMVYAVLAGQMTHMMDAAAMTLQRDQSHLLARETSRLSCVRMTLQMYGQAFLVTFVCGVVSGAILQVCRLTLLREIGLVLIMCSVSSAFVTLVAVPALLSVMAPKTMALRATAKWIALIVSFVVVGGLLALFLSLRPSFY